MALVERRRDRDVGRLFAPRTLAKILPAILAAEYPDEPVDLDDGP